MTVFGHAGHWAVQLLYAMPLLVMIGVLIAGRLRGRREDTDEPTGEDRGETSG